MARRSGSGTATSMARSSGTSSQRSTIARNTARCAAQISNPRSCCAAWLPDARCRFHRRRIAAPLPIPPGSTRSSGGSRCWPTTNCTVASTAQSKPWRKTFATRSPPGLSMKSYCICTAPTYFTPPPLRLSGLDTVSSFRNESGISRSCSEHKIGGLRTCWDRAWGRGGDGDHRSARATAGAGVGRCCIAVRQPADYQSNHGDIGWCAAGGRVNRAYWHRPGALSIWVREGPCASAGIRESFTPIGVQQLMTARRVGALWRHAGNFLLVSVLVVYRDMKISVHLGF
jgi:hypothetical protein